MDRLRAEIAKALHFTRGEFKPRQRIALDAPRKRELDGMLPFKQESMGEPTGRW